MQNAKPQLIELVTDRIKAVMLRDMFALGSSNVREWLQDEKKDDAMNNTMKTALMDDAAFKLAVEYCSATLHQKKSKLARVAKGIVSKVQSVFKGEMVDELTLQNAVKEGN